MKQVIDYIKIQNEVITKYNIDLCDGTKCHNDWSRTHAHTELRRVCKWRQENNFKSTFTLFHEIGHIENNPVRMKRYEEEYYATTWAIDKCVEYGIKIPQRTLYQYQAYVEMTKDRGVRRGGSGYKELNLYKYYGIDMDIDIVRSAMKKDGYYLED